MQYHNKKVLFTPEIITVSIGEALEGTVVSESITEFGIELSDGTVVKAEKRLCEFPA